MLQNTLKEGLRFIHPSSIIEDGAILGENVSIGPFCVIGKDVIIGDNVELMSHVSLSGYTEIGNGTKIYPFASIGYAPQDLKYSGEPSRVIIGKNNTIREYVTIQPGTKNDKMETVIGDNCLFMVGAHIAHDCIVGNNVIMANNATLAGHVILEDSVIIGGLSAIQQKIVIGKHAMIGGMSGVEKNVIPYGLVMGDRGSLIGINIIGLKRNGIKDISKIQEVYKQIFCNKGTLSERVKDLKEKYINNEDFNENIIYLLDFIERYNGICCPKNN